MRRISLALALLGAVAAAGCGGAGNKSSEAGTGGSKGVGSGTFTITIQNGQSGNTGLAITGGYVMSDVVDPVTNTTAIDCGVAGHTKCSADFPIDSQVRLTAYSTAGMFLGWSADCYGMQSTCTISGVAADQYVVASFGPQRVSHPNWTDPGDHGREFGAQSLDCKTCHGAGLLGQGLAVSCASCHRTSDVANFVAYVPAPAGTFNEKCVSCHATSGQYHQADYNKYIDASTLVATIGQVDVSANADGVTYATTVAFTVTKSGAGFDISKAKQARLMAAVQNADGTFDAQAATSTSMTLSWKAVSLTTGSYVATAAKAPFNLNAPPAGKAAFLYFYFGDALVLPAEGNYNLMDNVASAAKVTGGTINYTSSANVSGCENCHGKPYMKHGYRAAVVNGLPDFVACKACHYDTRVGTDFDWQVLANEPATLARLTASGQTSADWKNGLGLTTAGKYGYVANVMNDTHMSHAMEFAYPQSMANCSACHAGKLDMIFAEENFNGKTCKSCHPTTATTDTEGRAPSFKGPLLGGPLSHHSFDWANGVLTSSVTTNGVTTVVQRACTYCHSDAASDCAGGTAGALDGVGPTCYGMQVPLFKDLHVNYDRQVYTDATLATKRADTTKIVIGSANVDTTAKTVTVNFTATGAPAGAFIKPTVVMSLYGYNTRDFIVSGHSSGAPWTTGTSRWLEYKQGDAANPRVTLTGDAQNGWTATFALSSFSALYDGTAASTVIRAEVGVLPEMAVDFVDQAVSTTNPAAAIGGALATIDLTQADPAANAIVDVAATKKNITDAAKCAKCHSALGITFHSPSYGSAGTAACRLCHTNGSGGSHLEMQSRSIDSYVHAIHAFQMFDIKNVDMTDPVQAMEYRHHTESTYPNFTLMSCESCHTPGTYNAPAPTTALPSILSASSTFKAGARAIPSVPSVVTGPAARACGSCHRAKFINADDAAGLAGFNSHTEVFGYRALPDTGKTTYQKMVDIIDAIFP